MGSFLDCRMTKAGIHAAALALDGTPITFTKIVMGDGDPEPGTDLDTLGAVVHPRVNLPITRQCVINESVAVLGGLFTNNTMHDGFYWRELGLYADVPDVGEVLYSYAYSGDAAEYIPASGSSTLIEKHVDILTNVGNAANMRVYIAPDAYVTREEFDDLLELIMNVKLTAEEALRIAKEALRIALEALALAQANRDLIEELEGRIRALETAVFEEVTANPFTVTFGDLAGITLTKGVWNRERRRLECSKAA